jgi:hypothetical protein
MVYLWDQNESRLKIKYLNQSIYQTFEKASQSTSLWMTFFSKLVLELLFQTLSSIFFLRNSIQVYEYVVIIQFFCISSNVKSMNYDLKRVPKKSFNQ